MTILRAGGGFVTAPVVSRPIHGHRHAAAIGRSDEFSAGVIETDAEAEYAVARRVKRWPAGLVARSRPIHFVEGEDPGPFTAARRLALGHCRMRPKEWVPFRPDGSMEDRNLALRAQGLELSRRWPSLRLTAL